ncbi:OsmC family protein [Pseudoalteromonas mariniglutinosa]|uniref:OsmC family protein n=1 Tax=Pseudoalteromonas mariniglutinosa TaxID=206042 RepID=UPI00384C1EE9
MSEYFAKISWARDSDENYIDNKYSRGHEWIFDGGVKIPASSSAHIVPLPYSIAENVDPEEAFVASLSSCHMLFFLSIAAKNRYVVDSYIDNAVGLMTQRADGKVAITKVTLKPYIQCSGDRQPTIVQLEKMHHQAHEQCFIANSVQAEVITEIVV